jgi:hypothetical protein
MKATHGVVERPRSMHDGGVGLLPPPPPDDEDRRRFLAGAPGGAAPLSDSQPLGVTVPDDLRGLEDEIRAVQAELGIDPVLAAAPVTRWGRLGARLRHRWGRRFGGHSKASLGRSPRASGWPAPLGLGRSLLVGPVVAMTLLVIAGLVALLPTTGPALTRRPPAPVRLATPSLPPGSVGGLLPDVSLDSPTGAIAARALRPAVLMLIPDGCACPSLVHDLMGQVEEYPGLTAALVGSADPETRRLAVQRDGGNGRLPALVDRTSALARAYHGGPPGSAPTVLFVAPDGTLTSPPLVFSSGTRVEAELLPLGQVRT